MIGSIIVINTGLIHYFEKLKKDGQKIEIEDVRGELSWLFIVFSRYSCT